MTACEERLRSAEADSATCRGASRVTRWGIGMGMSLLWPMLAGYYGLRGLTDGKYRMSRRARLGLDLPLLPASPRRVWVHALSVGETLSVVPLVAALKEESPDMELVFSSATEAGREIAVKRLSRWVRSFFFMPHDFPWLTQRLILGVGPAVFVLVETDVWPNLLDGLEQCGIPSVLVNARLSEKSFRRASLLKSGFAAIHAGLDLVLAQSALDAQRFRELGISQDRVVAAGNLKYDAAGRPCSDQERAALRKAVGIRRGRPVWMAASTHEGEEEVLLRAHRGLLDIYPDLLLVLAPRQVRRTGALQAMCKEHRLAAVRRSTGESAENAAVYLVDTFGELSGFYALAHAAFVGGSLVPFGGHNPLEAVAQATPVFWGPYLSNFREIESDLILAGCGMRLGSSRELEDVLKTCLANTRPGREMKRAASDFLALHSGTGRQAARKILGLWNEPGSGDSYTHTSSENGEVR